MKIERITINRINPAPYNPRVDLKPGDADYEKLKRSINEFGYVEPIVWNKQTGNLVGGHQRYKILISEGATEVDASIVDLSIDKEKALNLALNRITGRWDNDKLASLLEELSDMPDIDVSLSGFDAPEISTILDAATEIDDDDFNVEEEVEKIDKPITKRGDLIQLGKHRLLCGDSSKKEDLRYLFNNRKAQLLYTDPPYNVDYEVNKRPTGKEKRKNKKQWKKIASDNLSQDKYEEWLTGIFENVTPFLDSGAPTYIWNGFRQFGPMHAILERLGFYIAAVITWAKPNFAISYADYNQQTEFCLYGWREGNGPHRWYGSTSESTLWNVNRDATKEYIHPTQKPVELAARALKNSSIQGDIVLDTFLGSGTTLICAEKMQRVCYGVEYEPKYCDAIVRRYIHCFGKESVSKETIEKYTVKNEEEENNER